MKLAFWKQAKEQAVVEAKPAAPAVATAVAPPAPTTEENVQVVRDLLVSLAAEKDANSQDAKLLRAAFSKASAAMNADAGLVTAETVKALAELGGATKDKELRQEAVSALGTIAVKHAGHGAAVMPVLLAALNDGVADIRGTALGILTDLGKTDKDKAAAIVEIFSNGLTSPHMDVREGAIVALATLALKYEENAPKAVEVLSAALSTEQSSSASQSYTGRNRAAFGLGEIAKAYPQQLDGALKGLLAGLNDKDTFVQMRTIESLEEIGRKYDAKKDEIVTALEKAKPNAIYVVGNKIGAAINSLRPPVKPQKSPEEIAAEAKREEENQKALAAATAQHEEAARVKAKTEAEKKQRHEAIKTLANKLPGKAL